MMVVVAQRLLGSVSWGLKGRLAVGGGISFLDVVSDLVMVTSYLQDPKLAVYGVALLAMVAASTLTQFVLVVAQNYKRPARILGEAFAALTGFKAALDGYRVGSGTIEDEFLMLSRESEHLATKCIESIPGCVLQCYALLRTEEITGQAVTSLMISALSSGFAGAVISFDFDVSPANRKRAPAFYGYVPDGGTRTIVFACMLLNGTLLLLFRSISIALLMSVGSVYFWGYWLIDVALYFALKLFRRDFHYFVDVPGKTGLFVSFMCRFTIKMVTDVSRAS